MTTRKLFTMRPEEVVRPWHDEPDYEDQPRRPQPPTNTPASTIPNADFLVGVDPDAEPDHPF